MDVDLAPDATWVPVSPRLAAMRRVYVLGAAILGCLLAVALLLNLAWPWGSAVLLASLGGAVWGWVVVGRNQRSWRYAERESDLLIAHGVMFRSLVVVPYGRMQLVDVTVGPVERLFGIRKVQLHTASATSGALIVGLPPSEAERLRDRLASRGEAESAGL